MFVVPSTLFGQAFDLERALALPPSPGAVGLLIEHAREPRASERIRISLSHPRPEIRAAAARVALVSNLTAVLPDGVNALAEEADEGAARELIRFVAMKSLTHNELVLEAAARLGMASEAGIALATAQSQRALKHLDALRGLDEAFPLTRFLSLVSRGNLELLGVPLAKAFRETDGVFWKALLETARDTGGSVSNGALIFGITKSNDAMRFATLLHILLTLGSGAELSPEVDDALPSVIAEKENAGTAEAFVLELLARHRGADKATTVTCFDWSYAVL